MKKKRHIFTPEEKVLILKRHFVEGTAISDLSEQYHFHVSVFYDWQKQFFENGPAAFRKEKSGSNHVEQQRIQMLEDKLRKKNEVLSELMEEHINLKKELGEL